MSDWRNPQKMPWPWCASTSQVGVCCRAPHIGDGRLRRLTQRHAMPDGISRNTSAGIGNTLHEKKMVHFRERGLTHDNWNDASFLLCRPCPWPRRQPGRDGDGGEGGRGVVEDGEGRGAPGPRAAGGAPGPTVRRIAKKKKGKKGKLEGGEGKSSLNNILNMHTFLN